MVSGGDVRWLLRLYLRTTELLQLFGGKVMAFVERIIAVEILDDYDLVSEFLKWLLYTKPEVAQYRGGHSGRGNFLGYFPMEEEERLHEFFLGRVESEPDDNF